MSFSNIPPINPFSTAGTTPSRRISCSLTSSKLPPELFNHILSFLDERPDQGNLASTSKVMYEKTLKATQMQGPVLYHILKKQLRNNKQKLLLKCPNPLVLNQEINFINLMTRAIYDHRKLLYKKHLPIDSIAERTSLLSQEQLISLKYITVLDKILKGVRLQNDRNKINKRVTSELSKVYSLTLAAQVASTITKKQDRIVAIRSILNSIKSTEVNSTKLPLLIAIAEKMQRNELKKKNPSKDLDLNFMQTLSYLDTKKKMLAI